MAIVTVEKNTYTVEALYQWDIAQILEIRGLSLGSVPEIHFTNDAMDRAIVRQARMDALGVVTADIPDSLLQKPYKITAYVCTYEGGTFETLYKVVIPVNARQKPNDYSIEAGEEVYSFNALENAVVNAVTAMEETIAETLAVKAEVEQAAIDAKNAVEVADQALQETTRLIESVENAVRDTEAFKTAAENKATAAENAATAAANSAADAALAADACKHKAFTVTLTAAGWSNSEQTVAVTGLGAENTVIICPAPGSQDAYYAAGVKATGLVAGALTFACSTTPSVNLVVNVLNLGVSA